MNPDKKAKTYKLAADVRAILAEQPNATAHLESLVRAGLPPRLDSDVRDLVRDSEDPGALISAALRAWKMQDGEIG